MKIPDPKLQFMFIASGIDKNKLHDALRTMGKENVRTREARAKWNPNCPTFFYCYVVSEFLFWYVAPKYSTPWKLKVPGDAGIHRFLKWGANQTVIDLTVDQFDNYEEVDYTKAKICYFLQSGGKGPSKRARDLAYLMDIHPNKWRDPRTL